MKILNTKHHYGLRAIFQSDLEPGTMVKITGNNTVNAATAGSNVIGIVTVKRDSKNEGTIDIFGSAVAEIKVTAKVDAGTIVKAGVPSGTITTAMPLANVDATNLEIGICWKGAAVNGTATIILF
jgi:hypothetical protein